jgi:hypothetical protein
MSILLRIASEQKVFFFMGVTIVGGVAEDRIGVWLR